MPEAPAAPQSAGPDKHHESARSLGYTPAGPARYHTRSLGHGRRAEIERRDDTPKVGDHFVSKKHGPMVVVESGRPEFISDDHIEDMDAWSEYPEGPGWYSSYTAVPVSEAAAIQRAEPTVPKSVAAPVPAPSAPAPPADATGPAYSPVQTKRVTTKFGRRDVYSFSPGKRFWNAWRSWKDSGSKPKYLTVGKDPRSGEWQASIWGKDADEVAQHNAHLEDALSRYESDERPVDYEMYRSDRREFYAAWESSGAYLEAVTMVAKLFIDYHGHEKSESAKRQLCEDVQAVLSA
jgi:hypothetical protein